MDTPSDDGFTKEELKKLLPYSKGINKKLLAADTALKTNDIVTKTLKKLKWDDLMHILFLVIGGFISYLFTNILGANSHRETIKELNNLKTEMHVLKSDSQKHLNEQNLIILDLKNQLDSIKTKQKTKKDF